MGPFFESLQAVPFRGEILSVGSALVWAGAVLLFRVSGRTVSPLALNLFKNSFAVVILILTMLLLGRPLLPDTPLLNYGLIGLSGLIGVAVSDTLFFGCLNLLGASLTAVVDCLYSPFVILFSFLFIGERLGERQILGVALILSALVWISRSKEKSLPPRKDLVRGIGLGTLAMITLAASIVMVKPLLAGTSVLWATLLRMAVGTVALGAFLPFHPRARVIVQPLLSLRNWRSLVPGAVLGGFVSPVVWMAGMKYTLVSIAAPLNQLNSIFIFVLAAIVLKEKVTRAKIAAVALATIGAFLVSWP
ncbi:MAG: DMT family transporter [Candidatus Aminicenantales bacterium]